MSLKNYKTDTFTFGKYKGELIEDCDNEDYLEWLLEDAELDEKHEETAEFIKNVENRLDELQA